MVSKISKGLSLKNNFPTSGFPFDNGTSATTANPTRFFIFEVYI
jgi:hypothetical protein